MRASSMLLGLAGIAVVALFTAGLVAWAGIGLLLLAVLTFLWDSEPDGFEDAWVEITQISLAVLFAAAGLVALAVALIF